MSAAVIIKMNDDGSASDHSVDEDNYKDYCDGKCSYDDDEDDDNDDDDDDDQDGNTDWNCLKMKADI